MRRRSLRRNRRSTRLAIQQLEPRLALAVTPSLVTDINATQRGSFPFTPTAVGDVAYFAAGDAEHGQELWKTDGTTAGTTLVKDISIGLASSEPYSFTAVGDKVFFVATDSDHGTELWVTDGTEDGTQLVADLATGSMEAYDPITRTWGAVPARSFPKNLTAFDGELYFIADVGDANGEGGLVAQLWKTDGTAEGTVQVTTEGGPVTATFVLGDSLFYATYDNGNQSTTLFAVGVSGSVASIPGDYTPDLTVIGSRAYFSNYTSSAGQEPWVTDGTADGTFMLVDAAPGEVDQLPNGSITAAFIAFDGAVYFTTNTYDFASGYDSKLWKTTGLEGGTTLVKDGFRSFIEDLAIVGGRIVFAADDGLNGTEIWQSDGSAEGTLLLEDLAPGEATPPGGAPEDLPVPFSSRPFGFTNLGDDLYFFANNGELWKTDGTAEGTVLVSAIGEDDGSGSFGMMAVLGDELLFRADDGETGPELWKSDGTAAGTELLRDIAPGTNDAFDPVGASSVAAVLGGFAYFAADDGVNGTELWKSDGTAAGTSRVRDIFEGRGSSDPAGMFTFKDEIYFAARDGYNPGDTGRELWKTDGTPEGTVLVLDIAQDYFSDDPLSSYSFNSNPRGFTAVGDFLYFIADDGATAGGSAGITGIWKTDGTGEGTEFVAQFDGTFSDDRLVAIGDYVFFAGTATLPGFVGTEIWYLDTTTDEFSPIDLIAGETSSFPSQLVAHDGLLYFVADLEGTAGLWTLPGDVPDEFDLTNLFEGDVGTIAIVNDTVYFSSLSVDAEGEATYVLYTTDGTPDGTGLANVPGLEILPDVAPLAAIGSLLFFVDQDADHGRELWTVSLDPGERPTGRVADGYLRGARIFADSDGDRVLDWTDSGVLNGVFDVGEGEAWTVTDALGNFAFPDPVDPGAALVTIGGVDISTGLSFAGTLTAPAGSTIVNPLTTLVVAAIGNGLSETEAKAQVLAGLGLPTVDLTTYDPLAAAAEDATALAVQKAAATVANILVQAVANDIPTAAVLANMAQQVTAATAPVNLASPTVITQVLTVATVAPPAAVVSQLASVNQAIVEAPNLGAVYASQVTGQSLAASVAENATTVATVVPEGLTPGLPVTFTIFGGADAALFAVSSAGVLSFKAAPNFEAPADAGTNNVYDVTVQAGDGTNTFTQGFVVTVTNVNEAPSVTSSGTASAPENQTAVQTVTGSDPDAGTTLVYSIAGGADAAKFAIDASTGILTFLAAPNFESPADAGADNVYSVTVRVSDGSLSATKDVAITVTNVNEAPSVTSSGTASAPENQTAVQTVTGSDPDAGTTLVYSIAGGADAAKFAIDASTGILTFLAAPNFESPADAGADNVYNVTVRVSDGSLSATKDVAITVTNVNEAPSDLGLSASTVAENAAVGTAVGTLSTSDVDAGDTFTYALVAGEGSADNSSFTIDGNTLKTAASFNFEAKSSYTIRVKSTDAGGLATEKQFTITVTDVVEPLAIDRVLPPASRTYRAGEVLQFTVVLTRSVTVIGKPEIDLTVGRTRTKAVYQSGSGTNQLVFAYTVKSRDTDTDGVALGTAIKLPRGSSIRLDTTNLPLALAAVNTSGVLVDTTPPKVNAVSGPANGSYKAGQVLRFTATASEPVTVTGVPTLPLVIGTTSRQASYVAGASTPTSLVFEYTVQAGETDANGIAAGRAIVLPSGASIVDGAGNAALLAIRAPNLSRVLVDSAGPVATSIKAPAAKTYGANAPIDFVVNFNEPVVVTGSPTLPVQIGSAARSAAFAGYAARSGNKSLVFRISPQVGDVDTDGVAIAGPLGLAGTVIADAAGNAAAGTLPGVNLSRVLVDGVGPAIVSVDDPEPDARGKTLFVRINFNEPVLVRGTPTLPFQIGGSPRQLTYVSGSKTRVLTFRYVIQNSDNIENSAVTPPTTLVLGSGVITDGLGNAIAALTLPG